MRARATIGAALALAVCALGAPAAASAAPALGVAMDHRPADPSGIVPGRYVSYEVAVTDTGDEATAGPLTVALSAPAALSATGASDEIEHDLKRPYALWSCSIPDPQSAECEGLEYEGAPLAISPGEEACEAALERTCRVVVTFAADPSLRAGEVLTPTVEVCGGGAPACARAAAPTPVLAGFGPTVFDGLAEDAAGGAFSQAGGRPFALDNDIQLALTQNNHGETFPADAVKDIAVTLPAGLIGDPTTVPTRCAEAELATDSCPTDSQVGINEVTASDGSKSGEYPVYDMVPAPGRGAEFGFNIDGLVWVHIYADVLPDGRILVRTENISQFIPIGGNLITLWGVPADPAHDPKRICRPGKSLGCASTAEEKAFLSLPTSCAGPAPWSLAVDSWRQPGGLLAGRAPDLADPAWKSASFLSHDSGGAPLGAGGCAALDYSSPGRRPGLQARPTTDLADSPTGLEVDVHTPQSDDPGALAEAHLRDTTLTLPEGFAINPSGANGLEGCTPAQIGIDPATGEADGVAPRCPEASKIGTVEVDTPLLDHPAPGAVYAATPHDNPFDSLLAIYIIIDDPASGTLLKMAGEVYADPHSGRLTTTVKDAPQLPFEHFRIKLKSGATAPLRTPQTCGPYSSEALLRPWSAPQAPAVTVSDAYSIARAPGGGPCASRASELPAAPSFEAGTESPLAGSFSPLVVHLRREDASQEFGRLTLDAPPGLAARLAGIPYCPDGDLAVGAGKSGHEEQAAPSCPAASRVGTVAVGAGAGPAPYHVSGTVYLAGPYEGAPLSLAIVTPATAGPYDLGTVVVRTALHIDPVTAQVTAVSDPIPHILEGIPLDLRSIAVRIDHPGWALNPTSCDPLGFGGELLSTLGRSAPLASPFQVGECGRLAFKPRMTLRLKGGMGRTAHPKLIATVYSPGLGTAGLARAQVRLPRSAFLDQAHIRTICTRVQWAAGGGHGEKCPRGSIYGRAWVKSPLFGYWLHGNVYLRSSDHKLPDLVLGLDGPAHQPIHVELAGKTDAVRGALRNTFEAVPDAPFTRARVVLFGGKRGLVVNSRGLCAQPRRARRANVRMVGHNGRASQLHPLVRTSCHRAGRAKKHGRHRKRR